MHPKFALGLYGRPPCADVMSVATVVGNGEVLFKVMGWFLF